MEYDAQTRMFWFKLGMAYHNIFQYEEAIKAFEKVEEVMELANTVLEIDPNSIRGLYSKGWGLYKQGHLEQALDILNEAWEKRFSYDHSHFTSTGSPTSPDQAKPIIFSQTITANAGRNS